MMRAFRALKAGYKAGYAAMIAEWAVPKFTLVEPAYYIKPFKPEWWELD